MDLEEEVTGLELSNKKEKKDKKREQKIKKVGGGLMF